MTPREFSARQKVHEQFITRWAIERAWFANAHFVGKGVAPYTADDFLGRGNRAERQHEMTKDEKLVKAAQMQLDLQRKLGAKPQNIPDWAYGRKGKPANG